MMKTPTIHNPTNFDPANYIVENYLDNKRPRWFFNLNHVQYWQWVAEYEQEMELTFGANWRTKIGECCHCGKTHIRWITATRHIPTGEIVVFGSDCTERLGFENKLAFKLAFLKKRATQREMAFSRWNRREKFLKNYPDFAAAVNDVPNNPVYTGNWFVSSIIDQLDRKGKVNERQMKAFIDTTTKIRAELPAKLAEAAKKIEEEKNRGVAPEGRCEVTGEVVGLKVVETAFGAVTKTMLKLANNSRVWLTVPAGAVGIKRGDTLKVVATFERRVDDKSFAFGSRPHMNELISKETV